MSAAVAAGSAPQLRNGSGARVDLNTAEVQAARSRKHCTAGRLKFPSLAAEMRLI